MADFVRTDTQETPIEVIHWASALWWYFKGEKVCWEGRCSLVCAATIIKTYGGATYSSALCANLGKPHCLRVPSMTALAFWSEIPPSLFWPFGAGQFRQAHNQRSCFISSPSPQSWWGFTAFVQIEIAVNLWILDQTELRGFPSEDLYFARICH